MRQLCASGGQSTEASTSASSNEHSGLISFRIDWFDLLTVQRTLKSLIQHHNSKASILWHSAFFAVQLSHPYMATGKNIALTRQIFVGKVMSLLSPWAVLTAFQTVEPAIGNQEPGRPSSASMVPAADRLDCGCMVRQGGIQSEIKSPEALSIIMTIV